MDMNTQHCMLQNLFGNYSRFSHFLPAAQHFAIICYVFIATFYCIEIIVTFSACICYNWTWQAIMLSSNFWVLDGFFVLRFQQMICTGTNKMFSEFIVWRIQNWTTTFEHIIFMHLKLMLDQIGRELTFVFAFLNVASPQWWTNTPIQNRIKLFCTLLLNKSNRTW